MCTLSEKGKSEEIKCKNVFRKLTKAFLWTTDGEPASGSSTYKKLEDTLSYYVFIKIFEGYKFKKTDKTKCGNGMMGWWGVRTCQPLRMKKRMMGDKRNKHTCSKEKSRTFSQNNNDKKLVQHSSFRVEQQLRGDYREDKHAFDS